MGFNSGFKGLKQNNVVHDKVNLELPVLHITNFVFTNLNIQIPKTKIYYYTGKLNQHLWTLKKIATPTLVPYVWLDT